MVCCSQFYLKTLSKNVQGTFLEYSSQAQNPLRNLPLLKLKKIKDYLFYQFSVHAPLKKKTALTKFLFQLF